MDAVRGWACAAMQDGREAIIEMLVVITRSRLRKLRRHFFPTFSALFSCSSKVIGTVLTPSSDCAIFPIEPASFVRASLACYGFLSRLLQFFGSECEPARTVLKFSSRDAPPSYETLWPPRPIWAHPRSPLCASGPED